MTNAAKKPKTEKQVDKGYSEWIRNYWRPMMAITYMAIVLFDFLIAPIGWAFFLMFTGEMLVQWDPITLSNGGIFHVAMGTVIGVASYTRGYEKIEGIRQGRNSRWDDNSYNEYSNYNQPYGKYRYENDYEENEDNFFRDNDHGHKNFGYNDQYNPNR